MNLNVFDVVKLKNGFNAIVVKVDSKGYIVKVVDDCCDEFLINEEDIKKILFKK